MDKVTLRVLIIAAAVAAFVLLVKPLSFADCNTMGGFADACRHYQLSFHVRAIAILCGAIAAWVVNERRKT